MNKNIGTIDRTIRGIVGVVLVLAFILDFIQGVAGIVGLNFGIVLLGTAAIAWCPPYTWMGIDTSDKEGPKPSA